MIDDDLSVKLEGLLSELNKKEEERIASKKRNIDEKNRNYGKRRDNNSLALTIKEPKFTIGQRVYHATPDSDQGLVLDCAYSIRRNNWYYLVTFGPEKEPTDYYEDELSTCKCF